MLLGEEVRRANKNAVLRTPAAERVPCWMCPEPAVLPCFLSVREEELSGVIVIRVGQSGGLRFVMSSSQRCILYFY